jgi:DNA-binding MarR family transcriptional regulator
MVDFVDAVKQFTEGDEDYDLWILLTRARNLVFRARELELLRYGLTPEQALILCIIHNSEEKLTPARIARLILRKPHTMSAMIERMEEKGLLVKNTDPKRKNMIRIGITEKGKQAYEITSKRGPIHRIMGALSENERDDLRKTLGTIINKSVDELGMGRDNLPSSE